MSHEPILREDPRLAHPPIEELLQRITEFSPERAEALKLLIESLASHERFKFNLVLLERKTQALAAHPSVFARAPRNRGEGPSTSNARPNC